MMSPIAEALRLVKQGLPCFPCTDDKRPMTPNGFKDAVADPEAISRLWRLYPGSLVGVPTGAQSGIDVLDIDPRHGGDVWLAKHHLSLPSTRVHRTRSGGQHLFLHHEPGIRCSAGRLAPGVDVRADGGYVIWWPAVGFPVLSIGPMARWPYWLVTALRPKPPPAQAKHVIPDETSLMQLVKVVATARPGERNSLTFWAACRAGEMVSSGLLRADAAAAILTEAAIRAGLSAPEARRTAWSGIRTTGGVGHA